MEINDGTHLMKFKPFKINALQVILCPQISHQSDFVTLLDSLFDKNVIINMLNIVVIVFLYHTICQMVEQARIDVIFEGTPYTWRVFFFQ